MFWPIRDFGNRPVITASFGGADIPLIHIWERKQEVKFWVYLADPGNLLGRARARYRTVSTTEADWLATLTSVVITARLLHTQAA